MESLLSGDPVFQPEEVNPEGLSLVQMPSMSCLHIEVNVVINGIETMLYHRVPRLPNGGVPGSFIMVTVLMRLFRVVRPKRGAHFYCSKGYFVLP
jgi:hypothetical protein